MTERPLSQHILEPDDPVLQYVTNRWSRHVVQPLLITLLVTSLFTAIATILSLVFSTPDWLYMPILCFVIVLEGVFTSLWLQHPNQRITDNLAYRAAELVVIILVTRLFTWTISNSFPNWQLYLTFLRNPLLLFLDPLFVLGIIFIVAAWVRGISLTITFSLLAVDWAEANYYLKPQRERNDDQRPFQYNRTLLVKTYFSQWIGGGIFLALCATITTFDLTSSIKGLNIFAMARLGLQPMVLIAILVYFLAGFLLMSQAKLQANNAHWLHTGMTKSSRIEKNWHRSSIRILLIIAFLAAFLPIGSTTGIGQILESLTILLIGLVSLIYLFFIGLLALLFARPESASSTPPPLPTPDFAPPPQPQAANETAAFIFSSAFWAIAIVLSVVAVSFFLRERGIKLNQTFFKQVWTQLRGWAVQLWLGISQRAVELGRTVRDQLQIKWGEEEGGEEKRPFHFIRINALSPREQIRYFYLSIVRRAKEKGVPRDKNETPLEYSQALKDEFPETEGDVEELTEAFLKARYSPQIVNKEEINPIKKRWKHMRSTLRRHIRREKDE